MDFHERVKGRIDLWCVSVERDLFSNVLQLWLRVGQSIYAPSKFSEGFSEEQKVTACRFFETNYFDIQLIHGKIKYVSDEARSLSVKLH